MESDDYPTHSAPRCCARSKWIGLPCRSPAVRGWASAECTGPGEARRPARAIRPIARGRGHRRRWSSAGWQPISRGGEKAGKASDKRVGLALQYRSLWGQRVGCHSFGSRETAETAVTELLERRNAWDYEIRGRHKTIGKP